MAGLAVNGFDLEHHQVSGLHPLSAPSNTCKLEQLSVGTSNCSTTSPGHCAMRSRSGSAAAAAALLTALSIVWCVPAHVTAAGDVKVKFLSRQHLPGPFQAQFGSSNSNRGHKHCAGIRASACAVLLILLMQFPRSSPSHRRQSSTGNVDLGGRGRMAAVRPGQTAQYLLVYEEQHIASVTRQEVETVVIAANGRLLEWHAAIGTALAASEDSAFSPNAVAKV